MYNGLSIDFILLLLFFCKLSDFIIFPPQPRESMKMPNPHCNSLIKMMNFPKS